MCPQKHCLGIILLPILIISSLCSLLVTLVFAQVLVQQRIVYNYRTSELVFQRLEQDIDRLLAGELSLNSELQILAQEELDGYVYKQMLFIDRFIPSHQIELNTRQRIAAKPQVLRWRMH